MICFVDYRTTQIEINSLKNLGYEVLKVPKSEELYDAINGHVDIQLNILEKNNKTIIINKNITLLLLLWKQRMKGVFYCKKTLNVVYFMQNELAGDVR